MPCLFLKFWLGVHHFSFKLNGGCAKPPERWQGWSGFYSPGMEDQDAHQPNEVVSLWTTDSDDRVIMSSEGQTTTLFIFRMWKLHMKVMQIHYHCATITSIGTSSMDGLLRDNGWVLKSFSSTPEDILSCLFFTAESHRSFCEVSLVCLSLARSASSLQKYCWGIKVYPRPNKQPDTWPVRNIWW